VITLTSLALFSGFSLNLMIQLGMGIQDFGADPERSTPFLLVQWAALFISVLVLWCLFSYVFSPLSLGFFEYFLLFPLIVAAGKGLEGVLNRFFPTDASNTRIFSAIIAYNGFTLTSLVITLRLASSIAQAAAMALGFSLGTLLAIFVLRAIHNRSVIERVPRILRGIPLMLISMGLLALIFSSLSAIFLHLIGTR
jgi:electron transport complex protein RnfA